MKNRAITILEYKTESSAASRLEAWGAAINMIKNHPFAGVGISSFGPAFPDHSNHEPRDAHNTFFIIAAESGLIAGLVYLLIIISNIRILWKNTNDLEYKKTELNSSFGYYFNEAVLVSFVGLIIGSLFLSLHIFEIFYFLCMLINSVYVRINNE
jgi:O-antigen ligase